MKTKAVLVGILVALFVVTPAAGEHVVVTDGNDTRGRADIKKVRVERDGPRKWKIRTFRGWRVNDFFEKGWFVINLDTIGDRSMDYFVFVRAKRRRLGAAIWRERQNQDDVLVAHVKARKVTKALMSVKVPFSKLKVGDSRLEYRWYVRSMWSAPKCPRVCFDRAPNRRVISEPLLPSP